jgi:muramoyltetrapeptide carboxypeptidase
VSGIPGQDQSLCEGAAKGPLIGGNLEVISALMGTPYQPNFKGAILLIEEVRQEPYKIDCMLSQMQLAGIFDQVVGIIFSQFQHCNAHYFPDRDGTSLDVIKEYAANVCVPCIHNFQYGHIDNKAVLPIGHTVQLDATQGMLKVAF